VEGGWVGEGLESRARTEDHPHPLELGDVDRVLTAEGAAILHPAHAPLGLGPHRPPRKGGVPAAARQFIMSFMSGRTCKLVLEGVSTDALEWRSGLPQGSPLSPALFLTYNSALLRACRSTLTMATGWIDNINLLGWGKSVSEAVNSINARVPELEEWL